MNTGADFPVLSETWADDTLVAAFTAKTLKANPACGFEPELGMLTWGGYSTFSLLLADFEAR